MIAVVNTDPDPRPTGWHRYELRINRLLIATFRHKREDGLAVCLRRAADAAERAEFERLAFLMQQIEAGAEAPENDAS